MNESPILVGDIVIVADHGPWYDSTIIGCIGVVTNVADKDYASTRVEILGHEVHTAIYMSSDRFTVVWPAGTQ